MIKRAYTVLLTIFLVIVVTGSLSFAQQGQSGVLMMATTTSTDNTGLLEYLAPAFKSDSGIELRWVATGTGKAIALGRNCDVDIVFTHDPDMEKAFVNDGYGVERVLVMYNDFVIVGPKADPAGVKGFSASDALKGIAAKQVPFASRGDMSGTHLAEQNLWKAAAVTMPDKESWYIGTGQGMINTLVVASERDAYCLTDRGTYIVYEAQRDGDPPLVILVEGDPSLRNQYSIMAVDPQKCGNARLDASNTFIKWITSPPIQQYIADFKVMEKKLFFPNAEQ